MDDGFEWEIWDHFQVRSAGFPSSWLDGLVCEEESSFETRLNNERRHLREVYQSARLQEAVVWQNPDLAKNFLYPWLDRSELPVDRSKGRRVERKLLSYLQRYCTKNEAIGTFGPIGWGRLRPDLKQPEDEQSPWIVNRTVYWEPWLFQELCREWKAKLRLSPRLRLQEGLLLGEARTRRRDGAVALSPAQLSVLSEPESAEQRDPEALQGCLDRGWLSRAAAVPSSPFPEVWARAQAEPKDEDQTERLDRLEEHRRQLKESQGRPRELLRQALALRTDLEQWGVSGSRFAGQTYSGRLPYYEDAQRRSMDLPSRYLKDIEEPLSLVLQSARWFVQRAETLFADTLQDLCGGMLSQMGEGCSATPLWDHGNALFKDPQTLGLAEISGELSRRWKELLSSATGELQESHSFSSLAQPVREAFAAPPVQVSRGRFHSVDLFFTSQSGAVLGEIHPGLYPFHDISTNFQHPRRDELATWYSQRADRPDLWPAWQMSFGRLLQDGWAAPHGYHLLVDPRWGSWREESSQLRLGDFSLISRGEQALVRHPSGLELTPLAFLQNELLAHLNSAFKPFDFGPEPRPRLTIDGLTVARKRWSLRPASLALGKDRATRHAKLQRWGDELGLPDELFVGLPKEVKPVHWQRRSILSCELFLSLIDQAEVVKLEEMYPSRAHAWVENPDGRGTGEFRFVAYDRVGSRDEK